MKMFDVHGLCTGEILQPEELPDFVGNGPLQFEANPKCPAGASIYNFVDAGIAKTFGSAKSRRVKYLKSLIFALSTELRRVQALTPEDTPECKDPLLGLVEND